MKQKILLTYVESGFGHISSMDSIYDALCEKYGDVYDIQKSYILTEDGFKNLVAALPKCKTPIKSRTSADLFSL